MATKNQNSFELINFTSITPDAELIEQLVGKLKKLSKKMMVTQHSQEKWSFFKYFVLNDTIDVLLSIFDIESKTNNCEIYLWGVDICSKNIETELYNKFIQVSNDFEEEPTRNTRT